MTRPGGQVITHAENAATAERDNRKEERVRVEKECQKANPSKENKMWFLGVY